MKKEYTGRCHCGKVKFAFKSEEITKGLRCDCSICIRKGIVMSTKYIPTQDIQSIQGDDVLTNYLWNDRVMNHYFCKICGVTPYAGATDYGYRINLGCVDNINPFSLEITINDGKSMEVSSNPGSYPGDL